MSRFVTPSTFPSNDLGRPRDVDYRDVLTGTADCLGIWRLDREGAVSTSAGKVAAIANWKDGGEPLTLRSGAGIVGGTVVSGIGGRPQLRMAKANKSTYDLASRPGPSGPWTMVFQATLSAVNTSDFSNLFGAVSIPLPWGGLMLAGAALTFSPSAGVSIPIFGQPPAPVYSVIASHDGFGGGKMLIDDILLTVTGGSGPYAGAVWSLGHPDFSMAGDVDLVGLWSADLLASAEAGRLSLLREYLSARGFGRS